MNIEFLYFDGCPNHERAFGLLQDVLHELHIIDDVKRVEIRDDEAAVAHKFVGSPTIRIDGTDIETVAESQPYAKTCRVYRVDGSLSGIPSRRMIRDALVDHINHAGV